LIYPLKIVIFHSYVSLPESNPLVNLQDGFEMALAGLQRPWPNGSVVVGCWRKIPVIIIHVNPDEILQPQAEYPWILGSHGYIYMYTMIHHELHTIMPLQSILAFERIIISSLNRLNQNPSPKKGKLKCTVVEFATLTNIWIFRMIHMPNSPVFRPC